MSYVPLHLDLEERAEACGEYGFACTCPRCQVGRSFLEAQVYRVPFIAKVGSDSRGWWYDSNVARRGESTDLVRFKINSNRADGA